MDFDVHASTEYKVEVKYRDVMTYLDSHQSLVGRQPMHPNA